MHSPEDWSVFMQSLFPVIVPSVFNVAQCALEITFLAILYYWQDFVVCSGTKRVHLEVDGISVEIKPFSPHLATSYVGLLVDVS